MYKISHSQPLINSSDIKCVSDTLRTRDLAQGREVLAFEHKFSQFQNSKGAVALNSGTSALHLSLLALDICKGDEVIIPSYVCTALLNAVHYTGAQARIVDVDDQDFNISVEDVKCVINHKTKAIIVPHMFGHPANIKSLLALKVPVIEDCAQSVGALYSGKKVGSFGVLSIFSFYATKVLTTGEGGMVTSNSTRLLKKIRDLRDYDNCKDYKIRYNYKMTDFQAALGINQLKQLPRMLARRRKIAELYHCALSNTGIILPKSRQGCHSIYFRYVIRSSKKNKIKKISEKQGIDCTEPVYKPLHRYLGKDPVDYPVTEQCVKEALSIPIYPALKDGQVQKIVQILRKI